MFKYNNPTDLVTTFIPMFQSVIDNGNDCCFVLPYKYSDVGAKDDLAALLKRLLNEIDSHLCLLYQHEVDPKVIEGIYKYFEMTGASKIALDHARDMVECKRGQLFPEPVIYTQLTFYRVALTDVNKISFHVKLETSSTFCVESDMQMRLFDASFVFAHIQLK